MLSFPPETASASYEPEGSFPCNLISFCTLRSTYSVKWPRQRLAPLYFISITASSEHL